MVETVVAPSQPRPENMTRKQVTDLMLSVINRYVRDCKRVGKSPAHTELVQLMYDRLRDRGLLKTLG